MSLEHSPTRDGTGTLADDLLRGADAIAEYIGEKPRQVYYLSERRLLPIFRVGRQLRARKSELDRALSATADL